MGRTLEKPVRVWGLLALGVVFILFGFPRFARGQGVSGPVVSDSKVGYIDDAILADLFRLRVDSTFRNTRPSRAEFFYAQNAPNGPGLPLAERRVDFQDVSVYSEACLLPWCSAFFEVPIRFLNPEVNANTAGLADLNAGLRCALLQEESGVLTFQFRTYAPTGDADLGLGTRHVSLEPALLFYHRLSDRAALEGEFRTWIPVGGTDFAGEVVRYGLGYSYDIFQSARLRVSPVAEFVGWTVLNARKAVCFPPA